MKEAPIISNYPREARLPLREKLALVLQANQLASGQATICILLFSSTSYITGFWRAAWVLFLCIAVIIVVSTWLAWRATSKLEAALGWRRANTVALTLISGVLSILGAVLLYVMTAWVLHRNGIKLLRYWNNKEIEAKLASLDESNTHQT